ncbi:MAG: hypothetical protein OXG16_08790 [Rhodospirillales bacterium]|nr:hypothetical protein [Rhodospirillales bacterium]
MRSLTLVAVLSLLLARSVAGAPDASVLAELNKLEPNNGNCRAYLVLENKGSVAFEGLKLDIVIFGADGVVKKRLAVQVAPLPSGKTSLKVFDVPELSCDHVGRLLLNDVLECSDHTGMRNDCLPLLSTTARTEVPFIK